MESLKHNPHNPKYPLGLLGLQVRDHWKEFRPRTYRALQKSGDLDRSLYEAQEKTLDLMDQLLKGGLQYHQAWERASREYAFLPEEEPEPRKPRQRLVPKSPPLGEDLQPSPPDQNLGLLGGISGSSRPSPTSLA